ncbi:MAG: 6-carboxytetrahydropterin synthase [Bryobacteraceae bacterium]
MIRVTRRYHFAASHRLHSPQLTAEENAGLYGKCNNPFGHGHNYVLDVSVRGPVDGMSGRAVDLAALDALVGKRVVKEFDRRNLNVEVDAFARVVPTTENLGLEIHRRLAEGWNTAFPDAWPKLEKIRIAETERNIFEVHGNVQREEG